VAPTTCCRDNRASAGGAGRLVLESELLARVDRERRIGRQDRIAADILVDEVQRIVGDVFASQRQRCRIEREPLDDAQLSTVSASPSQRPIECPARLGAILAGCAARSMCTVRVSPRPYSIVMTSSLCVMRLIVPSKTQSNSTLVIWQLRRGLRSGGKSRSASEAACPAAVSVTGGGNQPWLGTSAIATSPASTACSRLSGTRLAGPCGGRAMMYCSWAQSPARFGLPDASRNGRSARLAGAALNC
jgi:hypothetical protein